ncbi:ABC transporter permease [Mesorhizobium sp. RP14(2022)]|uniref:ABC transporter permease n=1 Tax=Mesorhizobium liriopis TaxID=2953882 RepID=A0ABT1C6B6_9HYPH|nr:ABC transporter permease [Mesorhizobium liriopis]MCO6050370.1 ABC transporter permease [Mesorhizobium liriopis]
MTDLAQTAPALPASGTRRSLKLARDRLLVLVLILAAWESAGHLGVSEIWISSPSAVGERLWTLALSGELFVHMQRTLTEAALGLALAFAVGVPIGIAMARYKYANEVAEPFIMALYSLPRVALAPLFIIWFGIDLFSKVMMAFSTVIFIFMLNIHEGLKTIDRDLVDLFRTMRAPRALMLSKVILPWLAPWVIASLRIGIGLSLIGAVVAELIGSSAGLGWYIENSAGRLDTTGVFAGLVALTAIAAGGNLLVARLEKRISGWRAA